MNSDFVRLLVVVAIALGVWILLNNQQTSSLIKNYGNVTIGGSEGEMADAQESNMSNMSNAVSEAVQSASAKQMPMDNVVKTTVHEQISDISQNTNVLPYPQISNSSSLQGNFAPSQQVNFAQLDCFPKDQLVAEDLLPREDAYNVWNQSNPPVQGHLSGKNFIESGHHYGLNTVGQSLKNANLQLRSDPLIPMRNVGPWQQSTIEADTNRRPFEIGGY